MEFVRSAEFPDLFNSFPSPNQIFEYKIPYCRARALGLAAA